MKDPREYLSEGTLVTFENGNQYEITGEPIGHGGGSLIYPAERHYEKNGEFFCDGILYALKECFPLSVGHTFVRTAEGEIVPEIRSDTEQAFLNHIQKMQLAEQNVSQKIYRTGSRILPIRDAAEQVTLTCPNCSPVNVHNTVTVMESLDAKGQSLLACIRDTRQFSPLQTFRVAQQILYALREIHQAGYLHLDIQPGNIFLRGSLDDGSDLITLLDFGCARPLSNGLTAPIMDRIIFTTEGFSAPEILFRNDGTLRLGPEADLYSVGCLLLYLLTGTPYDSNALLHTPNGRYLTRFKLRKIQCPKHLVDRMQGIIAHTLEPDPSRRYHTADEMLADVNDFIQALKPARSDLSAVDYAAFICYRHNPIDSDAAKVLQQKLEHFHVPRDVTQSRRPFQRVFTDEGELSSCADFGEQIRAALKNAAWLIVICSPDTPKSPWVNLEIDTFLEYHDRSRILAVLTAGTPETSFPEQLKKPEVFAASSQGASCKEVTSRIKKDAYLRIIAPMLSIPYDSLKQRHRMYVMKRVTAAATVCAAILAAFLCYALYQNMTIIRQSQEIIEQNEQIIEQEQELNESYKATLFNQAKYLASQAAAALEDNNPTTAISLALSALSFDNMDIQAVSEAEYVLTKALNLYTTSGNSARGTAVTGIFEHTDAISDFILDEENDILISYGLYDNIIYVWDAETCSILDQIVTVSAVSCFQSGDLMSQRQLFLYATQASYADNGNAEIFCYDYADCNLAWSYILEGSTSVDAIIPVEEKNLVLVIGDLVLYTFDLSTGVLLNQVNVPFDGISADTTPVVSLNDDHTLLAFTIYIDSIDDEDYAAWYTGTNNGIILYDLEQQTFQLLSQEYGFVLNLTFTDSGNLLFSSAHGYYGLMTDTAGSYTQSQYFDNDTLNFVLLNVADSSVQWTFEAGQSYTSDIILADYQVEDEENAFLIYGNTCLIMDLNTGEIQNSWSFDGDIIAIREQDNGFNAITKNGTLQHVTYSKSYWNSEECFPAGIDQAVYSDNLVLLLCSSSDATITKYEFDVTDENRVIISDTEEIDDDTFYVTDGVAVFSESSGEPYSNDILCYILPEESDAIHHIRLTSEEDCVLNIRKPVGVYEWNNCSTLFLYCEDYCDTHSSFMTDCIAAVNLETGEFQILYFPDEADVYSYHSVAFCGTKIYYIGRKFIYNSDGIWTDIEYGLYSWEIGDDQVQLVTSLDDSFSSSEAVIPTADQEGALIVCNHFNYGISGASYEYAVYYADLNSGIVSQILSVPVESNADLTEYYSEIWNQSGNLWAVVAQDEICVYDVSGNRQLIISPISAEYELVDISFTPDQEQILAVYEYDKYSALLAKYSLADGSLMETLDLGETSILPINLLFQYSNENTLILSSSLGSVIIDITDENWGLRADIEDAFAYDIDNDRFYTLTGTTLGYFRHYSIEELISMGQDILNRPNS